MSAQSPICSNAAGAVEFWRAQTGKHGSGEIKVECFFALTLDSERHFTGCHEVKSRAFGDPQRFADELCGPLKLRKDEELILIHNRPGRQANFGHGDRDQARAVVCAARARNFTLLDVVLVGDPDESNPGGFRSLYRWLKRNGGKT